MSALSALEVTGGKILLVMMESTAGTGHTRAAIRPKSYGPLKAIYFDPYCNYTFVVLINSTVS